MDDPRAQALIARVRELELEIARKDQLLRERQSTTKGVEKKVAQNAKVESPSSPNPPQTSAKQVRTPKVEILASLREIATMAKPMANGSAKPERSLNAGDETSSDYQALRTVAADTSSILEQEARKVVLGWKPSKKDPEAQLSLLRCLLQPLETVVAALMAAAYLNKMTQVLSSACAMKALEACSSCIALVEGVDSEKAAPLCGMVESVCENIRKLPISNEAAVKRQLLEAARSAGDSAREFLDLKESGKVNWGFEKDKDDEVDDDFDDEEDEDDIDGDDLDRLDRACKSLLACKAVLLHIGQNLKDDVMVLDGISKHVNSVVETATDFGVELYPPHDSPRVAQKAALLLAAATKLHDSFIADGSSPAPQFIELKSQLSSLDA